MTLSSLLKKEAVFSPKIYQQCKKLQSVPIQKTTNFHYKLRLEHKFPTQNITGIKLSSGGSYTLVELYVFYPNTSSFCVAFFFIQATSLYNTVASFQETN